MGTAKLFPHPCDEKKKIYGALNNIFDDDIAIRSGFN